MSAQKLLACPFCGGEAEPDEGSERFMVRCRACGAQGPVEFYDPDDDDAVRHGIQAATARWNSRATNTEGGTHD